MKPDKAQEKWIARVVSEPTRAALLNLGTGLGKTLTALAIADRLGANTVLVVGPLNAEDGWRVHAEKLVPRLPFRVIDSKHEQHYRMFRKGEPGVYFITRTYFALSGTSARPRQKPDGTFTKGRAQKYQWQGAKTDVMIFDESHEGNNRDTATYKVLKKPVAGFRIALSATPAGNKFDRLWETTRWLWPDKIDRAKSRWAARWCKFERDQWTFSGLKIVGELKPGAFVKTLPCYLEDAGEQFKVPVTTIQVKTPLTEAQRAQYDEMKRASIVWLDENPLVADLPVVQKMRLRQIALGEVTFNEKGEVDFAPDCESSKIKAAQMVLDRHPGEHVVFYTDSARFARTLAKRLGGEAWTGTLSKKSRAELKARFLTGQTRTLVAVIAAFGTGTDGLQNVCSTEVWCNLSFNDTHNKQCEGRLNRRGQRASSITRYMFVAPDSGDTEDLSKLATKRSSLNRSLGLSK